MEMRVSNSNERKEFDNKINQERNINSASCNNLFKLAQNMNASRRERDWGNKMSNQSENINQLYIQHSNSNNNINNNNQNNQSQNNEFKNNGENSYNPRNYNDLNNINQGLNNIVRSDLKSRGLVNSNNSSFHQNHTRGEVERKGAILENIKQQISLDNKHKRDELDKKKREDDKYLYAM